MDGVSRSMSGDGIDVFGPWTKVSITSPWRLCKAVQAPIDQEQLR